VHERVVIVDDHEGFRSWARVFLEAEGYDVVGEAEDGVTAIAAARALQPDLVLLDIQLPDMDGFDVAGRLLGAPDPPAIVLISSRDAAAYGPQILASGVRGFLPKSELSRAALDPLLRAVR